MALRATLTSSAPGWGVIDLTGAAVDAEVLALRSIQTGAYLHTGGTWQSTPEWHRPVAAARAAGGLRMQVGPEIIDGVNAAPGRALALVLRDQSQQEYEAALILPRQLPGSQLAPGTPAPPFDATVEAAPVTPAAKTLPMQVSRSRLWWARAAGAAMTLGALGIAAVLWGPRLSDGLWSGIEQPPDEPASSAAPAPAGQRESSTPVRSPDAQTGAAVDAGRGVQLPPPVPEAPMPPTGSEALEVAPQLTTPSTPAEHWVQAETLEQRGDCNAAAEHFLDAADGSAEYLFLLAQRLDPQTLPRPRCDQASDPLRAEDYYQRAVDQGHKGAARRLGELLTAPERSPAEQAYGRRLLKQSLRDLDTAGTPDAAVFRRDEPASAP